MTTATLTRREQAWCSKVEADVASAFARNKYSELPPMATDAEMINAGYSIEQSRVGQESRVTSVHARLRAIMTDDVFWKCAAHLPDNNIHTNRTRSRGRPLKYPSWLLYFIITAAGIEALGSILAACVHLADPVEWKQFAQDIDRFVPDGWTKIHDVNPPITGNTAKKHPTPPPPRPHHVDYFVRRWIADPDELPSATYAAWKDVRGKVNATFGALSAKRAQTMGFLNPTDKFDHRHPNRNRLLRTDGTYFTQKVTKKQATRHRLDTYVEKGNGILRAKTKHMISSVGTGEWNERIWLGDALLGKHPDATAADESPAIKAVIDEIQRNTNNGVRMLAHDSAVRGTRVTELQKQSIIVVNYPHAQSNPSASRKGNKRRNSKRLEKAKLRTVYRHHDINGDACTHPIYAVGGHLMSASTLPNGEQRTYSCEVIDYQTRPRKDNNIAEYLIIRDTCRNTGHTTDIRVPCFHSTGSRTKDSKAHNWGEYVRIFAPSTPQFRHIYGARNDTESVHATVKRIIKRQMLNPAAQQLRILGCGIAENAYAYQLWAQKQELPNALDGTNGFL